MKTFSLCVRVGRANQKSNISAYYSSPFFTAVVHRTAHCSAQSFTAYKPSLTIRKQIISESLMLISVCVNDQSPGRLSPFLCLCLCQKNQNRIILSSKESKVFCLNCDCVEFSFWIIQHQADQAVISKVTKFFNSNILFGFFTSDWTLLVTGKSTVTLSSRAPPRVKSWVKKTLSTCVLPVESLHVFFLAASLDTEQSAKVLSNRAQPPLFPSTVTDSSAARQERSSVVRLDFVTELQYEQDTHFYFPSLCEKVMFSYHRWWAKALKHAT